jgi:hypothetical protein
MPDSSPWDEITTPGADFNVRQVSAKTAVPCFWGRDAFGRCLFVIELAGDFTSRFRADFVRVRGIEIDLREERAGTQRLVLRLEKQVDRDLFEGLCHTLARALVRACDAASALAVALAHVRRWKRFLSGNTQRLSPDQVRGLYAELTFLLELLDGRLPPANATDAWRGPDRSQHDFVFGDSAVEIKSLAGTERNAVRISSEDQLESLNDNLFLRIYRLSDITGAHASRSLNGIIEAVRELLADADAADAFDRKLAACGYAPLPEYDEPRYIVSEMRTYLVRSGFPRLVRPMLPTGIFRVSYDLALEAIDAFKCAGSQVFGEL